MSAVPLSAPIKRPFGPALMDPCTAEPPYGRWPKSRIFSHISTLPTLGPALETRISWVGVTASPVCSPSGRTKEYEIYGGVGFSGENAQIVASTVVLGRGALGSLGGGEGLGWIPPVRPERRLLLMILFQG